MDRAPRLLTATILFTLASPLAAGPLDPPAGPVAPTMKTIAQAEPRTPIESIPFTISQPGSYYLAKSLTASADGTGITISTGNVTLDLAGFTLSGGGFQGAAISGDSAPNVAVRNGVLTGWRQGGVLLGTGAVVEDLRIVGTFDQGPPAIKTGSPALVQRCHVSSAATGISVDGLCRVIDCTVLACLGNGIVVAGPGHTTISGCIVGGNGGNSSSEFAQINTQNAFGSVIRGCAVTYQGPQRGIRAGDSAVVSDCSVSGFGSGTGIQVGVAARVGGCTVLVNQPFSTTIGVVASETTIVEGCSVRLRGDAGTGLVMIGASSRAIGCLVEGGSVGIRCENSGCVVSDNNVRSVSNAGTGILVTFSGNMIVRNHVTSPFVGTHYSINPGNRFGPIIDATAAGDLSLVAGASHPQANFKY